MMKKKNVFFVKFAAVAIVLGLFSPSVHVQTEPALTNSPQVISVSLFNEAEAFFRGGGFHAGGFHAGGFGRVGGFHAGGFHVGYHGAYHGGYYGGYHGGYHGGRYYGGAFYHAPVAGALALGAVTGLAIGSVIASVPPACTTVYNGSIAYKNCSGTFYQPFYQGGEVYYRVVPAF